MLIAITLLVLALLLLGLVIWLIRKIYRLRNPNPEGRHDFEIAVLGPAGSGKTLFLSSLLRQLVETPYEELLCGRYISDKKEKTWRNMAEEGTPDERGYYPASERVSRHIVETELNRYKQNDGIGTAEAEDLYLEIWYKPDPKSEETIRKKVLWRDVPGGAFDSQDDWDYNKVNEILRKSRGICLLIDAPAFLNSKRGPGNNQRSSGPALRNYAEVISFRLEEAEKKKECFPVWLIFTKGDLLDTAMQSKTVAEYFSEVPQLSTMIKLESGRIQGFCSLVSVNRERSETLYTNIWKTFKDFYKVICKEIKHKEKVCRLQIRQKLQFTVALFILVLILLFESFSAYGFYRLPIVQPGTHLSAETAHQYARQIFSYLDYPKKFIGYRFFYKKPIQARLKIIREAVANLVQDSMKNLPPAQLLEKGPTREYRSYVTEFNDNLELLQRISRHLYQNADFAEYKEFATALDEWGKFSTATEFSKLQSFYRRLSQNKPNLREFHRQIEKYLFTQLQNRLKEVAKRAKNRVFPANIDCYSEWYQKYTGCFTELDKKFSKFLAEEWRHSWRLYLNNKEETEKGSINKARNLLKFYNKISQASFLKAPQDVSEHLQKVTEGFLAIWEPADEKEQREYDTILAKLPAPAKARIQFLLFEKQTEEMIAILFNSQEARNLKEIIDKIDLFCDTYKEQTIIKEGLEKWRKRRQDLDKIKKNQEVKLRLISYECSETPPKEVWDDRGYGWTDKLYLYVCIKVDGKPFFLDLGQGELSYHGAYEFSLTWQPWSKIELEFLDLDGNIGGEDDDLLAAKSFDHMFSILDLTSRKLELESKQGDDKVLKYSLEIKLVEKDIPTWLENLYNTKKE